MNALPKKGGFERVGECLYRYSSNGVYYARIKTTGKEIRRSLETADRDLAKRRLSALKDDIAKLDPTRGRTTVAELCDQYIRLVQHRKPKTVASKELIIRRLKAEWPGGSSCPVRKVKPSDIELWLAQYKFGPVSRNLHLACAKDIFALAKSDGVIAHSPAAELRRSKLEKPIRKTPSFEDFKAIVTSIRGEKLNADAEDSANFIEFLGLAGLGQAEASALTWSDIDWQNQRITTFRHKTKSGFVIPIYPQLRPLLERLSGNRRPAPDEPVFVIRDGKKALAGACRRLGLPAYTQRALRRMFITRALEKAVDVKVIAEWQGHKDGGKLILDTYSHVNRNHANRMAQLMAE